MQSRIRQISKQPSSTFNKIILQQLFQQLNDNPHDKMTIKTDRESVNKLHPIMHYQDKHYKHK